MLYTGQFRNRLDQLIQVDILTGSDRTGTVEIGSDDSGIWFTDDPADIESQVGDSLDTLLLHQATVRLYTRSYRADLFTRTCTDATVNISRDGETLFAGFVEPMAYSQPFCEETDQIELNCIDCLAALQYARYADVGAAATDFDRVRREATSRTFLQLLTSSLRPLAQAADISGHSAVRLLYDGSKAADATTAQAYTIFSRLAVSELLLIGDTEDDTWTLEQVVEETLRYLGLHIIQQGTDFYVFSWESVTSGRDIPWHDLLSAQTLTTTPAVVDIATAIAADCDTQISIAEVYNRIRLTCRTQAIDQLVSSPLDSSDLTSPFRNKQLYMTEYAADGEGSSALDAFDAITHDRSTDYDAATVTDWYLQVKDNPHWTMTDQGTGDLIDLHCADGLQQQTLPNLLATQIGAALLSWGKVETKTGGQDNAPVAKITMTDTLTVSVLGNASDDTDTAQPTPAQLRQATPVAVYQGPVSGGVLSPADDDTVNYIVISGRIALNPVMKLTDNYAAIRSYKPSYDTPSHAEGIGQWAYCTVPSRQNDDGRYYTQRWYQATSPTDEPQWDQSALRRLVPFTETGPQEYEFEYSAIGDSQDHISKVAVLACMLTVGDKCLVETGTQGQPSDFEWRTYKERSQCADDDEYYAQSFTVGFDPKIGDKLIGTEFDIQNNISYRLGLDAEGTAIPIRRSDRLGGRVTFRILGPVNTMWGKVTRRHKTWFRREKWNEDSIPLMAHVDSIVVRDFEIKVYSDNALADTAADSDIVYVSDTDEHFVNVRDDIETRIHSALTADERRQLGVTDRLYLGTPVDTLTSLPVTAIRDRNLARTAKPEQLYVERAYAMCHEPRILLTQNLEDTDAAAVTPFTLYRHPALPGRTFHVEALSRNLRQATATIRLNSD